jgi:hypothetical protein
MATNNNSLWDMSDEKHIKDFIDYLQAATSNNQIIIAGLVLLLREVENKRNHIAAVDYCDNVIQHLFEWTMDCDEARRNYVKGLKTRKVNEFIN